MFFYVVQSKMYLCNVHELQVSKINDIIAPVKNISLSPICRARKHIGRGGKYL